MRTGIIILDTIDIICISFSVGSTAAYVFKRYQKYRKIKMIDQDPIVAELKKKSPIVVYSESGKPLRLPLKIKPGGDLELIRDGDQTGIYRYYQKIIRNKKLSEILRAIVKAKKYQKNLRLLQDFFMTLNTILTTRVGLHVMTGGGYDYVHIIIIALPSTIAGFLTSMKLPHPLISVLVPILIVYGRDIKDIPDPLQRCRDICKAAEEYHNEQVKIEMKKFGSLVEETAEALQLPIDKVPLICSEEKHSLIQRFKLKSTIKSKKIKRRIQHFSEFIKQFPECNDDTETLYEKALEGIKVKND